MRDQNGNRYWNAFPECCDFYGAGTDDAGYLAALMAEAKAKLSVDEDRIFFIGHSNGGFMVNRMGCQFSKHIAGIISISGSVGYINTCNSYDTSIVDYQLNVLNIYGLQDVLVNSWDSQFLTNMKILPASGLIIYWANLIIRGYSGFIQLDNINLDSFSLGKETVVYTIPIGSNYNGSVTQWKQPNGKHWPAFNLQFPTLVFAWLKNNTRQYQGL
ncbi:hypothetical protein FGO68_gene13465 [Halteria grandinella]|uniref:Phospholipase/carboxylesterase/thioesterase domain-containing protein n=1 Tax=Halteria grandinella TaxID=5974 RepID=A0A8J8T0D7_HALGN|nr:hypothetical protein FGO68_gene13465 [Halteria grandinella]